jgi:hypothetical protein
MVQTQMYRMENGTLRIVILKTKGLRSLVQNRFPFATKMPIRTVPFSKIGVWKETTKQNNRVIYIKTKKNGLQPGLAARSGRPGGILSSADAWGNGTQ